MSWTLCGHLMSRDGYGVIALNCLAALRALGADVRTLDMRVNGTWAMPGEKRWTVQGDALVACVPDWYEFVAARRRVGLTMFESTRLPPGRAEAINRTAACVVPSRFCAETFEDCGVDVPIHVVPLGIDPEVYRPDGRFTNRPYADRPYTFLWSGTPDLRKGWDLAYRAFWAAFGGNPDARLVMHFREMPRGVTGAQDKNVQLVKGQISLDEWIRLLGDADCFVFPSRGEGWGLPPREAAATGLPVIATDWGGLRDGLECWGVPLRVKELRPAEFGEWEKGEVGEWAEPDFDHLVALMREAFEHRARWRVYGERAAEWMRDQTWERTAAALCGIMAQVAGHRSQGAE